MKLLKMHRHPHISRKKARHTAALLTVAGGMAHYLQALAAYEAHLFMVAGIIAIYCEGLDEPHVITLTEESEDAA